jgi:hypothetical protein
MLRPTPLERARGAPRGSGGGGGVKRGPGAAVARAALGVYPSLEDFNR